MRILHTADWHLGKKLEQSDRTDEQQLFLAWLIEKLRIEQIDVLIVAGDIFDTGNPSNTALQQYYSFLRAVKDTCCKEVIIIGGNHDSISTLNAPRHLLKFFNVHVVGGVPEHFSEQIIEINGPDGNPALVVCAVPFLRDKDIRLSISGETAVEREARLKQGICDHYKQFLPHISQYKESGIPVITTGHLFAAGSSTSESEKDIHVGNLGQIGGDQFPQEFDYIALGHIHRPQIVSGLPHIRYSGSPLPLSFSETEDKKQVVILDFSEVRMKIEEHEIPCWRRLIRVRGDLAKVKERLLLLEQPQTQFPCWVEVQVQTETMIYDLNEQLEEIRTRKPFIERFFTRQIRVRAAQNLDEQTDEAVMLNELQPAQVFLKRCEAEYPDQDYTELLETFEIALEQMEQKEVVS